MEMKAAAGRSLQQSEVYQCGSDGTSHRLVIARIASGSRPAEKRDAEKTFEATVDNVVNTLESAYGVNRGKRQNNTKGFGALGTFVGTPEAAEYSRSQLFSGQELEVVARFSIAGGGSEASDTEKKSAGAGHPEQRSGHRYRLLPRA
jgi:hypothetical protein